LIVLLLAAVSATGETATAAVPSGFTDTLVASIGSPEGLAFTPDGRLLVSTQAGFVRVIANGTLLANPALDLRAKLCNGNEGGIPGVTADPNFAVNRFVYLYYTFNKSGVCDYTGTAQSPVNRVSRFVLSDNNTIDPLSEVVLLDNMPAPVASHIGGDLHFGKDGYLYVSVGDGECDYKKDSGCQALNDAARDQNVLLGKILRITRDGAIPPGNPFTGADSGRCNTAGLTSAAKCQETYGWGLRNPFRMDFDPNAAGTRFFINDVGQDTWEEIDLGQAGADYGWNIREGPCALGSTTNCGPPPAGMTNPIYSYDHSGECQSVNAGAFVPNGAWPAAYDNSYLYGDIVCGKVFQLVPDGSGGFSRNEFASLGPQTVIAMIFGPSGSGQALYYTSYAGEVRRIDFVGTGNRPPTAMATATPTAGQLPLTVNFDASGSFDPDPGDSLTYVWQFGDGHGGSTTSPTFSRTYTTRGTYTAQLFVRDTSGATSATVSIRIDAGDSPPAPRIDFPTDTDRFSVGQTITLRGSATDPEDGALPDTSLQWKVERFHIDHTHPWLQPTNGNNIPILGSRPDDLDPATTNNGYLIITLTATDSVGASATVTRIFRPNLVNVTFNSTPAGVAIGVNETTVTTPQTLTSWEALPLDVVAPAQVTQGGNSYVFDSWSDGITQPTRTITTPATAATYGATYQASNPGTTTVTFGVGASGDDGDVVASGSSYPPVGSPSANTSRTVVTVGRRSVHSGYDVYTGLLRFDTSTIPDDATVTAARLRVQVTAKQSSDGRNLAAEWYGAANWPIDAGDYALDNSGSALAGSPLAGIDVGAASDFSLSGLGSLSKTGFSALRLHLDGGQPAGDNYLQIASFDHGTLTEPQLVVTFSTASPTPPANTSLPTISGTAQEGQTLTASTGSWSGTAPITYAYQWRQCDAAGAACSNVGTNSSTYALSSGDVGRTIRVVVTATNSAGSQSATSAQTAVVAAAPTSTTVTFTVGASGDDGDVVASGLSYPPAGSPSANTAGTAVTVARRLAHTGFEVYTGLLRFDTSSIPDDATVTAATLRVQVTARQSSDGRSLAGEWYDAANWPIDAGDYALNNSGSALAGSPLAGITVGIANDFALSGLGSIAKTGFSALRLHLDGGQPAGDNYLLFASFDHGTLTEPQLVVTYTR
jgi:glucose/arabinose dehydrogenase/PKD repeat protein